MGLKNIDKLYLVLAAAFIATYFYFVYRFTINIPYIDDFNAIINKLIKMQLVGKEELFLLDAWIEDIQKHIT